MVKFTQISVGLRFENVPTTELLNINIIGIGFSNWATIIIQCRKSGKKAPLDTRQNHITVEVVTQFERMSSRRDIRKLLRIGILLTITFRAGSIKVYKSTAPLSGAQVLSGLILQNNRSDTILTRWTGVSICVRFNFKQLQGGTSVLYKIESGNSEDPAWKLADFTLGYSHSFLAFGKDTNGMMPRWIVKEKDNPHYNIWSTYNWHHVCMSFEVASSRIAIVKVNS